MEKPHQSFERGVGNTNPIFIISGNLSDVGIYNNQRERLNPEKQNLDQAIETLRELIIGNW